MATYQFVPEHNGIEIYFDTKPAEEILDELRGNGWRWHRVKECWFTKKSDAAEALAKRLCGQSGFPAAGSQSSTITIQQSIGSTFVSTLTIRKDNQGYSVSSTNNQIICCDCRRFFSIHAVACPFCGCPLSYIAEFYFKEYNPDVVRQREIEEAKRKQEEQRRLQAQKDEEAKQDILASIARKRHNYSLVYWNLEDLSKSRILCAAERARQLEELNAPINFSDYTYIDLLREKNSYFEKALCRAKCIKKEQGKLSDISDKEWNNLINLSDSEFNKRICALKTHHKMAQERAEAVSKKRELEHILKQESAFKELCGRYHIGKEQLSMFIEKYGSQELFLQKLQIIDNIGGEYRHKINVLSYIDSPEILKQLVKTL